MVVLKNEDLLPLKEGVKIYVEGISNLDVLNAYGEVVKDISEADIVVKRITTPWDDPKGNSMLERFFRQGRLWYNAEELAEISVLSDQKPTVIVAHLERPSVLTEINEMCGALMADFGTSDEVLADVLFGERTPQGKLPFELPSSKEAVEKQMEDVPYDSEKPLYNFGYGLSY
jgi:beta-glucosidase